MSATILLCLLCAAVAGAAAWLTANRRAHDKQSAVESRLQIIEQSLENAATSTFVYHIKRRELETTQVGAQLIGLAANHTLIHGDEWLGTIYAEDRARCQSVVAEAVKTGERYVLDYRVVLPDGQARWLRSHGLPKKSTNGKVAVIYGTLMEISKLKQLEFEARAREERFRDAAIAADFYTFELDLTSNTFTFDRPARKSQNELGEWVYGNESISRSVDQINSQTHPDDIPARSAMIERIQHEDVPYETETRSFNPGAGALRWTLTRGKIVRDATGRKYAVRGIAQDIHDRKSAELKLRETEARLDRTTRGTNDGLWEYDLAKHSIWISPRFAEMLGYEPQDFINDATLMSETTHPDDDLRVRAAFDEHLKTGATVDIEIRKKTKAGEWRWYRIRGAAERDAQGTPLTISGSQQDVTEMRQYQQALIEATREAAAATASKSQFLANMSHEIRTPMNGVIGMTELLLETALDSTQRDFARTIRHSAAALLTVINDILDFSKVEAGKLELEYLDMDLRDTIEDVARLLQIQAHAKGLQVTAVIDPALPDLVRGDAGRIRQVLLNLGGNAVKFTQTGEVAISCKAIEHTERHTVIRCEVRDTGIGIPADRIDALFQAFVQVDTSTTRQFGGTGLGLSISKRLVELMGGEIGALSDAGVGSVFWFTLQLDAAQNTRKTSDLHPPLKDQRVLVVEDNASHRNVIMEYLRQCHMEPVCASSAEEGLALLQQAAIADTPFEVALLDHQMPSFDGEKLGRTIRADATLNATRLILLTSSGQRGDGQRFSDLGFAGYLLKPVTQRDLADCLLLVLAKKSESWHLRTQPIVTRHALRTQRVQTKHSVLLAEDNPVNQKVACRTLEKLGYRVDVAADGDAAVKAWATGRYDLILMDCQMPHIDGYEATRQIRAQERDGKRIPIVALTAHAMKGANEDCAAAGMDDFLTKPIDRVKLEATLERWLRSEEATTNASTSIPQTAPADSPIDWDRLLKAVDQDHELARELAILFIDSGLSSIQAIVTALENGDYGKLGEQAHEIKGASANLQANATYVAAERLEAAARNGDTLQVPELAQQLNNEVARTVEFLRARVA